MSQHATATGLRAISWEFETVTVNVRGEVIARVPGRAEGYAEDLGHGVNIGDGPRRREAPVGPVP